MRTCSSESANPTVSVKTLQRVFTYADNQSDRNSARSCLYERIFGGHEICGCTRDSVGGMVLAYSCYEESRDRPQSGLGVVPDHRLAELIVGKSEIGEPTNRESLS